MKSYHRLNPHLLSVTREAPKFVVGDKVTLIEDFERVKRNQKNHGEGGHEFKKVIGKIGCVVEAIEDDSSSREGRVKVCYTGKERASKLATNPRSLVRYTQHFTTGDSVVCPFEYETLKRIAPKMPGLKSMKNRHFHVTFIASFSIRVT